MPTEFVRRRIIGERVVLHTPENPRLHGAEGIVETVEDWGAYVETKTAATGVFRALWEEMRSPRHEVVIKEVEYAGEICCTCGGSRMTRSGACLICLDCGTSGGCG